MRIDLEILRSRGVQALAAVSLAWAAAGAQAQDAEVFTLNIEPQPAGQALMELAGSSGVQILVSDQAGAEIKVDGLKGDYQFEDALAALLTDTGLEYEYASESVVLVRQESQADEAQDAEAADSSSSPQVENEDPLEIAQQTVTGSRLMMGDPTVRVFSFTAEDIRARGVTTVEELFRTLPFAYAGTTTQNNDNPVGASDTEEFRTGGINVGISTVNLRALGSANTLVLLNGRRTAGVAGVEDNYANLVNVPLSAIERVDIQLDGSSAVYGADAIGGVVNFITKKNYTGASVQIRDEYSSTDADASKVAFQGGYGWGSGQLTAVLSRDSSQPITNEKTGWTSYDYRDRYGVEFDSRDDRVGQPGVVCPSTITYPSGTFCGFPYTTYQLPQGHSGVGATVDDFTTNIVPADVVEPQNGEHTRNDSGTFYLEQYVTEDLRLYADFLYSNNVSTRNQNTRMFNWPVPASNAFNPFGKDVLVTYYPIAEIESGSLREEYSTSGNRQRSLSAGLIWNIADTTSFEFNATRSKSVRYQHQFKLNGPGLVDPMNPLYDRMVELLASSDPSVAINLFGDGSVQSPELGSLYNTDAYPLPSDSVTKTQAMEPLLRGQFLELWGGPISYALGAEFREETIYREVTLIAGEGEYREGRFERIGVARPTRKASAYFAEFAVPLVGERNARPGLDSLVLSLQARRDTYKTEGADGGVDPVYDYVNARWTYPGEPNIIDVKQSATSPRFGIQYGPTEEFVIRGSWSESFRPPVWGDLFSLTNPTFYTFWSYVDPFEPSGSTEPIIIPSTLARNATDTKSEHSENTSFSFDWTPAGLPGFRWTLDWSKIEFFDKIENVGGLFRDYPEVIFALPDVVERDAEGNATLFRRSRPINIASKTSEIITTEFAFNFNTSWGDFTPRLMYTRVLDETFQITEDSEPIRREGTVLGSDKYRLSGQLTWYRERWAGDLFVYYTPSYLNNNTGSCLEIVGRCEAWGQDKPHLMVDSYISVDLTLSYTMDNGIQLRAGGRNILDAEPPDTLLSGRPYDSSRWDARGQVLFVEFNWEL
ncbi:TonB-dependent receptor [Candidatus Foliamicus sp.]